MPTPPWGNFSFFAPPPKPDPGFAQYLLGVNAQGSGPSLTQYGTDEDGNQYIYSEYPDGTWINDTYNANGQLIEHKVGRLDDGTLADQYRETSGMKTPTPTEPPEDHIPDDPDPNEDPLLALWKELLAEQKSQSRIRDRLHLDALQVQVFVYLAGQQADGNDTVIQMLRAAATPATEGPDELNGRIRGRLANVDPAVADFLENWDVRIVNRPSSFWNRFKGPDDPPVRKVDENGHVYWEIAVDEDLSEFERLKLLRDAVRRTVEFQDFEKENYHYSPDWIRPAIGSPEYPAYLRRLEKEAEDWARAAGATEEEISSARWSQGLNAAMGPGGYVWSALELFAAAKARRAAAIRANAQSIQEQAMREYLEKTAPRHVIPGETKMERPEIFIRNPRTPQVEGGKLLSESEQRKQAGEDLSIRKFLEQTGGYGLRFQRNLDSKIDYSGQFGKTYEQMGNVKTIPFWSIQRQRFLSQINGNLDKADYLILDLTGFPENIKTEVSKYLENLPQEQQDRIFRIGFQKWEL